MSEPSTYPVKKGESVELEIERLAFGGKAVARVNGYTVFVSRALPGQRVRAMIIKRKKGFAEARLEVVLRPSPQEVTPRCDHTQTCGGCVWQHLDHAEQLVVKREQVRDCLERLGNLSLTVEPTLASPQTFGYRNKMEFSFGPRWLEREEMESSAAADRFGAGLHVRGRFDRVVNVDPCHLFPAWGSEVLAEVRRVTARTGLPAYSTRTHSGTWRFLVVRDGVNTGERMALLITHPEDPGGRVDRVLTELEPPLLALGVTSFLHGTTASKASVAVCERIRVVSGAPFIHERLLDHRFRIAPNTFFQTNTRGAEALFTAALERGAFTKHEVVWDLYCGAGAISLPLASRVKQVFGVELVPESIAAARQNALDNGVENATFLVGDVLDLHAELPAPDAVIIDPPRDGIHPGVLSAIVAARPKRVVYVSCNPATLARDLALFTASGYDADSVLPVDMFPHTAHVECVTVLRPRSGPES